MKIDKWIYTSDEIIDIVTSYEFDNYTIFIKSQLVERHDHNFTCGTLLFNDSDYREMIHFISVYPDCKFLLTQLDVESKHIVFNLIKDGDNHDPN